MSGYANVLMARRVVRRLTILAAWFAVLTSLSAFTAYRAYHLIQLLSPTFYWRQVPHLPPSCLRSLLRVILLPLPVYTQSTACASCRRFLQDKALMHHNESFLRLSAHPAESKHSFKSAVHRTGTLR